MNRYGLKGRAEGLVGDIGKLPFGKHSFDLIWSEGAIDNIGFEKGISHWHGFLKDGGYIAVTCPSWLTGERPDAVSRFWEDAGSHLDSVDENIRIMTKHGYRYIASFTLPDECWTKNYFIPRSRAIENLTVKYIENDIMKTFIEQNRYEEELFSRYSMHYGYVFYIAQKNIRPCNHGFQTVSPMHIINHGKENLPELRHENGRKSLWNTWRRPQEC